MCHDGGEESRQRQKALARSTMAARSFSSPQGELEMHRLRRALERVSFDQTLEGRLDESDGETKPPSRRTLSQRSLYDSSKMGCHKKQLSCLYCYPNYVIVSHSNPSDGLLFPASPLDWDSFTDPEYLFNSVPLEETPQGQCRSCIHGMLSGRPVSWEVSLNLEHIWVPEDRETKAADVYGGAERESWEEIIHHLTARSIIRDFEKMAQKENRSGNGDVHFLFALNTCI